MNIAQFCIKRPVFTVMGILVPVVLGVISLTTIGVDLFPNVELPVVTVTTTRQGTSVEEMETGVTKVVEEAVNTVSGIDTLQSTTTEGVSVITIQFDLKKNRDVAQNEVQSKVNTVLSSLPTGTDTPVVQKFDVDAAPVLTIAISGERNLRELTEIADKTIGDRLRSLEGVGTISVAGGRKRAINVTVDTKRLQAFNLSIEQVRHALATQNIELPGGRVDQGRRELVLRTVGRAKDAEAIADIIVADIGGRPVRIRDLGPTDAVTDSFEEPRSMTRLDGRNAVSLVAQKQSGNNTVSVIDNIKDHLGPLQEALAREGKGDIRMEVIRDQSVFIKASLHEVELHLVLGAVLVVLTILLFLRDWRTTIIAGVAIPVSIIAVMPAMWALDLTLNNITLIALVLVIGIVIDDAVIVIENIYRWMEEEGASPVEAAIKGTKEITPAVVATTLSLVVIFLPLAFMSGVVGMFLSSFGITCAIAIAVSLIVSLTLTPMLAARSLKKPKHTATSGQPKRGSFAKLIEDPYLWTLRLSLRHRFVVVLLTILVTASIFPLPMGNWLSFGNQNLQSRLAGLNYPGLLMMVGFNFVPQDDQSEFEISIRTPEGWSLQQVDDQVTMIERRVRQWPEVTDVLTQIGDATGRAGKGQGTVTQASIYLRLVPLQDRKAKWTQFDLMQRAREMLHDYPDLRTTVQLPAAIGGFSTYQVEYLLTGPDLDRLNDYSTAILAELRSQPGLVDVDTTLQPRKPEVRIEVDRERASDLGVSIQTIAATLQTLVGGQIVTDFKDVSEGEVFDVWLRAIGTDRDDPVAVEQLTIPSTKAGLVRLGSVAAPTEAMGPSQIDRAQRQRKISIGANLRGIPSYDAGALFEKAFANLDAPATYSFTASGSSKNEAEAVVAFILSFAFSILFMYMILAAQFESYLHPISILLALPVTIPFALLTLLVLGQPLTLFSVLGLFLLVGIVKKNGILQIDYTNHLRLAAAENPATVPTQFRAPPSATSESTNSTSWDRWVASLDEPRRIRLWAILQANSTRLRPILMTTIMLIAAMIPVALGTGPGSASRADMAKVIVGGQALSLLLSLLVTPVAYSLFDDLVMWSNRRLRRQPANP